MTKKLILGVLVLGAVALVSSPSRAQSTRGKLKLSLDTRFLGVTALTVENEDNDDDTTRFRTFEFGFGSPEVGLSVGYTVIDGLVVGGRFALAFSGTKDDPEGGNDGRYRTFGFRILPYVEYGFNIGRIVPFIVGTLGYRNDYADDITNYDEDTEVKQKDITNLFVMGAGGGAHFFLLEQLSLDATLMLYGDFGKYKSETETQGPDGHTDYHARAFEMNLLIGVSGWI